MLGSSELYGDKVMVLSVCGFIIALYLVSNNVGVVFQNTGNHLESLSANKYEQMGYDNLCCNNADRITILMKERVNFCCVKSEADWFTIKFDSDSISFETAEKSIDRPLLCFEMYSC